MLCQSLCMYSKRASEQNSFTFFSENPIIISTLLCATNDAQNTSLQWNSILRNSLLHLLLLFCKVTKNQRNRWNVSLSWYVKTSQDRLVKIFHQVHQICWKHFYTKHFILNEILNSLYVTWTVLVMLSKSFCNSIWVNYFWVCLRWFALPCNNICLLFNHYLKAL